MTRNSERWPMRTRRVVVGMLAASLGLTGCTSTEGEPIVDDAEQMTYTEASAELDSLITTAQDAIGGEWTSADGGAEACELPSGETGARSPFGRFGPGMPKDQLQPVVDVIVAAWTDAGFTPAVTTKMQGDVEYTAVGYPETGKGKDGLYVELQINENGSGILGQTRCVPGDYAQINRDYREATPSPTLTPQSSPAP